VLTRTVWLHASAAAATTETLNNFYYLFIYLLVRMRGEAEREIAMQCHNALGARLGCQSPWSYRYWERPEVGGCWVPNLNSLEKQALITEPSLHHRSPPPPKSGCLFLLSSKFPLLKCYIWGWWDVLEGKGSCYPSWLAELDHWNPRGGREATSAKLSSDLRCGTQAPSTHTGNTCN
jgi:hypothetical protein